MGFLDSLKEKALEASEAVRKDNFCNRSYCGYSFEN